MKSLSKERDIKKDVVIRLRRIEGQVKGIEKMVDNEACCKDILIQIAAIRAATNKVGALILENYAKKCLNPINGNENESENEEAINKVDDLINTLTMFLK